MSQDAAGDRPSLGEAARGLGGAGAGVSAYSLVLWAFTRAPVAPVAALRESGILIGVVLARLMYGRTSGTAWLEWCRRYRRRSGNLRLYLVSMANAWWSGDVAELLASEPERIVQRLAVRLVETHYLNRDTQLYAWRQQITLLQAALRNCPGSWRVLFEYPMLRLGRRIDVILLTGHAIMVLEFKVGATSIATLDRQQAEDYALDLFDFHADSRSHPIVPILVATQARPAAPQWPLLWHGVTPVLAASGTTLEPLLQDSGGACPKSGAGAGRTGVGSSGVSPRTDHR